MLIWVFREKLVLIPQNLIGEGKIRRRKSMQVKNFKNSNSPLVFLSVFPPPGSTRVEAVLLGYIPVERSTYCRKGLIPSFINTRNPTTLIVTLIIIKVNWSC